MKSKIEIFNWVMDYRDELVNRPYKDNGVSGACDMTGRLVELKVLNNLLIKIGFDAFTMDISAFLKENKNPGTSHSSLENKIDIN